MKSVTLWAVCLLLLASLNVQTAEAQTIQVGPRIGYDVAGDIEDLFLGIEGRAAIDQLPIILNGVFDFYLTEENTSFFQFSANALYAINASENSGLAPYVGAGLSINRFSVDTGFIDASNTDTGINLIGGAHFAVGNLMPYAQVQLTLGDADLLTVGVGLPFNIGGGSN